MLCISGRFDETVIEERRKAAEAMLQFSTTIPALYNSPQLKEFFRVRNSHKSIKKLFFKSFNTRPLHSTILCLSPHRAARSQGLWIPRCPLMELCLHLSFHSQRGGPQTVNLWRRRRGERPRLYLKISGSAWAWRWGNQKWRLRPTARWAARLWKTKNRISPIQRWMTQVQLGVEGAFC